MRKAIIIVIVVLVLLVGGYFGLRAFRARGVARSMQDLQTIAVERGDLTGTIGATGMVRPDQTAVLSWQTSGIAENVAVQEGDEVESDQLLASLTQSSLPQNIILARSELVNAKKALDDLQQSHLAEAQAFQALDKAQQALDDLEENTLLQQAQAMDALLKAQETYSDTLTARDNLNSLADSQKAQDARAQLERAEALVHQLQKYYNSLPGTPQTNPDKATALFNLRMAKLRRDQAQRLVDLYGGAPGRDELAQADANVALAAAKVAEAQSAWDRIKDGPNPADEALLEARLADAQRAYERVRGGPNADDISAAQARVAAAQATLNLAALRAPFAATITRAETKPGDLVNPGTLAFRLDDLSRLLVDVRVSEVDINQVKVGQPVSLTFDAILGKEYSGTVIDVGQVGEASQGVVEFPVTVELTDPDMDVKPGMTAAVSILVDTLEDVLLVPNRAVRLLDGKRVVYVHNGEGPLVPKEIILGASSDTMSEVVGGELEVGDIVVLNPPPVFEQDGPPGFMGR